MFFSQFHIYGVQWQEIAKNHRLQNHRLQLFLASYSVSPQNNPINRRKAQSLPIRQSLRAPRPIFVTGGRPNLIRNFRLQKKIIGCKKPQAANHSLQLFLKFNSFSYQNNHLNRCKAQILPTIRSLRASRPVFITGDRMDSIKNHRRQFQAEKWPQAAKKPQAANHRLQIFPNLTQFHIKKTT